MKKQKQLLIAAYLLAVLVIPIGSYALQRPVLPRIQAPLHMEWAAERLELSEEQRSQIRDIIAAQSSELILELAAVKNARKELFETIHEHPPSEVRVRQASAGVAWAETDLALTRSLIADEIYGVLTPEQQDEIEDIRQDLRVLVEVVVDRLQSTFLGWLES